MIELLPPALGIALPAQIISWDERDVMLYALAVGAGMEYPQTDLDLVTENSHTKSLTTLPGFLSALTPRLRFPPYGIPEGVRILHAAQHITLHKAITVNGSARAACSLHALSQGTKGARLTLRAALRDMDDTPLAEIYMVLYLHGIYFTHVPVSTPTQPHAHDGETVRCLRVIAKTQINQPLLYRLLGDRNPIHSDPTAAQAVGLERTIMHGLCTFGFALRAACTHIPKDARITSLGTSFSAMVFPGDDLETTVRIAQDHATFETTSHGSIALKNGHITFKR